MVNSEIIEDLLNIANCCKFKGDCMGCSSCSSINAVQNIIEENDKLKAEIEQLNNKLCFNEPAIKEMQNSNHSKDDINFLIKENFDLAYVNKKLSDEIEQLKLYATNLINTRNLSEETATSIRAKMQRELMMQKEIEQLKERELNKIKFWSENYDKLFEEIELLKAELEKLNYNPGGYQFG